MAYWVGVALMWIGVGIYAYNAYEASKARREYEHKAQRAVEAVEGWRDAYLKVYQMNDSKEDDHA
ncbi:hypothetical protein [Weissella cibaria]|uniref:Uncharacterized protein n=1 Tax=Weissella cibaria TaxID=137591 RepID=A0A2S1KQ36_9LACO|nr:hypothetical protein [Weissella cibaria]AWF95127.1 hypothetical protein B6254_0717 [Weissella cibaria]